MEQSCKSKPVFNKDDFNSSDGMLTYVWGPSMWHTLHTISFNYPVNPDKETRKKYFEFYSSLKHVLPCRYCRINLVNNMKKVPLNMRTMKNRDTLSRWVYRLHEEINTMLGKKSGLSYEDVRERYEMFRARCIDDTAGKKKKKIMKTRKRESGCTNPLYGVRSKCVLSIVPRDTKCNSFSIDKRCKLKRRKTKKVKGKREQK